MPSEGVCAARPRCALVVVNSSLNASAGEACGFGSDQGAGSAPPLGLRAGRACSAEAERAAMVVLKEEECEERKERKEEHGEGADDSAGDRAAWDTVRGGGDGGGAGAGGGWRGRGALVMEDGRDHSKEARLVIQYVVIFMYSKRTYAY